MRLILVRHGNTFEAGQTSLQIGAKTDLPLTSFGLEQAMRMAIYLSQNKIEPKAIFAGNLQRQTAFAKVIARPFSLALQSHPALTEIDYGPWEGLSAAEITSKWPKEHTEWEAGKWSSLFGSSQEAHVDALTTWFDSLKKNYAPNDTILAVSSNGLLRLLHKGEKVKTGHFCELELLPHGYRVDKWNLNPHH